MGKGLSEEALRCGIIDVGSNTIRAAVYAVQGSSYELLADHRDFSNLLTFVEDGQLSDEGAERLCRVLREMKTFCGEWSCTRVDCFATASLRGIGNFEQVRQRAAESGVQLTLLSGEEEALCDYAGLMQEAGVETGIGMDLGGGSGQLFRFCGRQLKGYASFPIGVMAMKRRFSMGCGPGEERREEIRAFVRQQLDSCLALQGEPLQELYVMGGTIRAAVAMRDLLLGPGEGQLSCAELEQLFSSLSVKEGQEALLQIDAERIRTMGSGLIVMQSICEYMGAGRVIAVRSGVREGYLWKNVMKATSCSR